MDKTPPTTVTQDTSPSSSPHVKAAQSSFKQPWKTSPKTSSIHLTTYGRSRKEPTHRSSPWKESNSPDP
eukprot:15626446-Heterocapsa_arctica.AAC.1